MNISISDNSGGEITQSQATEAIEALLGDEESGDEMDDEAGDTDEDVDTENGAETADGDDEENDAESDEESDDDDDDADDDASDESEDAKKFTVKVDGEEFEVDQDELVRGYQRNADYTRKTQELAEIRREATAEQEGARDLRLRYEAALSVVEERLMAAINPDVDMDALYEADPAAWMRETQARQARQVEAERIREERERIHAMHQEEMLEARKEYLQGQVSRVVELIPEWRDRERAKAERLAIRDFSKEAYGFSDEELSKVTDARIVALMRDAKLYRDIKSKTSTVKPFKRQPSGGIKPKQSRGATSEHKRAFDRLRQSGSQADALAAIHHFI